MIRSVRLRESRKDTVGCITDILQSENEQLDAMLKVRSIIS